MLAMLRVWEHSSPLAFAGVEGHPHIYIYVHQRACPGEGVCTFNAAVNKFAWAPSVGFAFEPGCCLMTEVMTSNEEDQWALRRLSAQAVE